MARVQNLFLDNVSYWSTTPAQAIDVRMGKKESVYWLQKKR